ncbi:hypothetical protein NP493_408g00000 [Ridgeia piscesae]|uniref:Uncharacterized protein n=1 Tax=Ridgeia piscesae TaxID=27915 RepID=A0AAD9L0T4_RIDPI|nr:hypothetical protein NP493_408g00000 [Ridgeia piscesae]
MFMFALRRRIARRMSVTHMRVVALNSCHVDYMHSRTRDAHAGFRSGDRYVGHVTPYEWCAILLTLLRSILQNNYYSINIRCTFVGCIRWRMRARDSRWTDD